MNEIYPELCCLMMRITRMHHKINMAAVSELGIQPSQHFLLMCLSHMGSAVSQTQIACEMEVTPASVARTIKNLDAGGYIERNESEGDGRRNEIHITDKGRRVTEESRRMFHEIDKGIYAGFSEDEIHSLRGMLRRMLENICAIEQERKAGEETDVQ